MADIPNPPAMSEPLRKFRSILADIRGKMESGIMPDWCAVIEGNAAYNQYLRECEAAGIEPTTPRGS